MPKTTGNTPAQITRRRFLRRTGLVALGVSLMPLVQACGGGGSDRAAGASGATSHEVQMNDQLKFVPDKLTIKAGDTVTWRNVGTVPHTATGDPTKAVDPAHVKLPQGAQPWDSGTVNGGQSWSHTFDMPGEYAYFCIPHEAAGMLGAITVTS